MKKFKSLTLCLVAGLFLVLTACAPEKEAALFYEDGIVNLDGPWEQGMTVSQYEDETAYSTKTMTNY